MALSASKTSRPARRAMLLGIVVATACSTAPSTLPSTGSTAVPPGNASGAPPETRPATPRAASPADLSARPLVWFAPLPPMPTDAGRPFTGSDDFMELFPDEAPWQSAGSRVGVFKLYGEWVAYHASPDQLRTAIEGIARRGLAVAVEMGPLDPPPECGQGIEGFAGLDEAQLISQRIREAGGTLQVVALDEPWYFAHVYDGPGACRWSVGKVAAAVAGFTKAMRAEWPGIVIGDTEPTPAPVDAGGLMDWLRAYREAAGEPFAFLHLDLDWSRTSWPSLAAEVSQRAARQEVPVGVIYNGGSATSDASWLSLAGRRVIEFAEEAGADPAHLVFQSWMDKPDRALPESDPLTFAALIERYGADRAALGDPLGPISNLAVGSDATASLSIPGSAPGKAVDGIADTSWSAGAGPPAFIEIDLGSAATIGEIRLIVAQFPSGATDHRVSCRAAPGAAQRPLGSFTQSTADVDVLVLALSPAVTCRFVRVRTLESPSWVAWREIEVYPPE